ncbi:MAG: PDZ domain-containing protein [Pirellulales bacterium]|nr:PDZ domain-containing protein [Pirellulales bacterium]
MTERPSLNSLTMVLACLLVTAVINQSLADDNASIGDFRSSVATTQDVQEPGIQQLLEAARKAATARISPSIVRIETIGGLETVDNVLIGQGPTTGLIISADGYIVSSAFNFAQKPASILIGLPDGTRVPAELVARDFNHKLVLLKLQDVPGELVVPEVVPTDQMRVGQWAFALGKTYDPIPPEVSQPNVSQGIISALNRIWGRAIQTDAKVSPVNYGGPLVDLHGRVSGILAPLSPEGGSDVAGYQWYDSGIGFAIPLEHVLKILPRWKEGQDLHPGILGINMRQGNQYADAAVVAVVRPNSPAYKAGWKANDKIVQIAGKTIERQTQVREALGPYYAEDTIDVVLERGDETIKSKMTLVQKLEAYARPFLGLLPQRKMAKLSDDEPTDSKLAAGVNIRYVYAESAAEAAGLRANDQVVSIDGRSIADINSLREVIAASQPEATHLIAVTRGEEALTFEVELSSLPESIPGELPEALPARNAYVDQQPPIGLQHVKIPEFENDCVQFVPHSYDPRVPYGVIVYFHEPGKLTSEEQERALVDRWKSICEKHDLILLAPKARDPVRWQPSVDAEFVNKVVEKTRQDYHVDDQRVIAHGYKGGGAFAYAVAFSQRQVFRAVVAVEAGVAGRPPEADPAYPLAFFTTTFQSATNRKQLQQTFAALRRLKYPVTVVDLGEKARYFNQEELEQLARWVDTLDRI